jgi:hypothetical protein
MSLRHIRCGRCNSLLPDPDEHCQEPPAGPVWKGKTVSEMTRAELEEAVLYFRDAHVEAVLRGAANDRRMRKMAEALQPEQINRLDNWIEDHMNSIFQKELRDDGSPLWPDWQRYEPNRNKKTRRVK